MFDDDPRWGDSRDRDDNSRDLGRGGAFDVRDRDPGDPRDVFMRDLDLPHGHERERVHDRGREYTLRESESRTLSTVEAFRVVSSRDLSDHHGRPADPRAGGRSSTPRSRSPARWNMTRRSAAPISASQSVCKSLPTLERAAAGLSVAHPAENHRR